MHEPDPLNAAATVGGDLTPFFRAWRTWSDEVRATTPMARDLRYGPSEDETLDLAVPRTGAPLVVFFHGGYWRALHKDDATYVMRGFLPHGVAVAVVNYALVPAVTIETIVAQAQRALHWLRTHAADYGYDAARIVVCGHSAGGHLAAMCAVDAPVHAVATLSGLHDLVAVAHSYVNGWLQIDDERAARVSPVRFAPAAPTRVLAIDGERETSAFHQQSRDLVDAWRAHGCVTEYDASPGDNHYTLIGRLYDAADPLTRRIAALAHQARVDG